MAPRAAASTEWRSGGQAERRGEVEEGGREEREEREGGREGEEGREGGNQRRRSVYSI